MASLCKALLLVNSTPNMATCPHMCISVMLCRLRTDLQLKVLPIVLLYLLYSFRSNSESEKPTVFSNVIS
jgi:hypothetical protein